MCEGGVMRKNRRLWSSKFSPRNFSHIGLRQINYWAILKLFDLVNTAYNIVYKMFYIFLFICTD